MNTDPRHRHFESLTAAERKTAVVRLADQGLGDSTISAATGLDISAVRSVIGQQHMALEEAALPPSRVWRSRGGITP